MPHTIILSRINSAAGASHPSDGYKSSPGPICARLRA